MAWRLKIPPLVAMVLCLSMGTMGGSGETVSARSVVEKSGMRFEWQVVDGWLEAEVSGPTTGWVVAGFHTQTSLKGARLVMASVIGTQVRIEEHLADPPMHRSRLSTTGEKLVELVEGVEKKGKTRVAFRLPLDSKGFGATLIAGQPTHLVLAWSHDDDFNHHSAMRTALSIIL